MSDQSRNVPPSIKKYKMPFYHSTVTAFSRLTDLIERKHIKDLILYSPDRHFLTTDGHDQTSNTPWAKKSSYRANSSWKPSLLHLALAKTVYGQNIHSDPDENVLQMLFLLWKSTFVIAIIDSRDQTEKKERKKIFCNFYFEQLAGGGLRIGWRHQLNGITRWMTWLAREMELKANFTELARVRWRSKCKIKSFLIVFWRFHFTLRYAKIENHGETNNAGKNSERKSHESVSDSTTLAWVGNAIYAKTASE